MNAKTSEVIFRGDLGVMAYPVSSIINQCGVYRDLRLACFQKIWPVMKVAPKGLAVTPVSHSRATFLTKLRAKKGGESMKS